jgi:carbamoyl-phosphate synthase large subunit
MKRKILLAGIGSGSLGLELVKCLSFDDAISIYGADSDPSAYGISDKRLTKTFVVGKGDEDAYCQELLRICKKESIVYVVPGAETTNRILCVNQDLFRANGLVPFVNCKEVFNICSNKVACNLFLESKGLPSLQTLYVSKKQPLETFDAFPCVVKPASQSGGSNLVFLAEDLNEAKFFAAYLSARGFASCVQEYIDSEEEFTVGVMSSPQGLILSSIALKRNLSSKLSRSLSYSNRVISSGWSQGRIEAFPMICDQAEKIALALGSTWALNIQGRVRNNQFIPFEINPRHSGTSFFRALSGVNEILIGLDYFTSNQEQSSKARVTIKPASYSRILTERVVFDSEVDNDYSYF